MRTLNEEIARIKSEVAEIASKTFTGKSCAENVKKALDKHPETCYNKDTKTERNCYYDYD